MNYAQPTIRPLALACPTCLAQTGEGCREYNFFRFVWEPASYFHSARKEAAR